MKYLAILAILSIVGIMADSSEEMMSAQWVVELKPEVNPQEIAQNNGFLYEGKHPVLPNIHLFRVEPQHRTRDAHPVKVESLKRDNGVVWSEPQIARSHGRRQD